MSVPFFFRICVQFVLLGGSFFFLNVQPSSVPVTPGLMENAMAATQVWPLVDHPNIATLKECFSSKQILGTNALFFAHEFFAGAQPLSEVYSPRSTHRASESTIWNYVVQILAGMRHLSSRGLIARCIHPSKVLLSPSGRIKLSSVGIADVLLPGEGSVRADLYNLAILIVSVVTKTAGSEMHLAEHMGTLATTISRELFHFIATLLTDKSGQCATAEDASMLLPTVKIWGALEASMAKEDTTEQHLATSLDNGRHARLMMKLGLINERPDADVEPQWAETGDRYLLKLFRDYVFHQVRANRNYTINEKKELQSK
jgi:PAB-dependent poly(A)-specific ribonuclease subunit 3